MPALSKCPKCGRDVVWVLNLGNTLVLLDAEPSEQGTVSILAERAVTVAGSYCEEFISGPRYTFHRVTCPKRRGQPAAD